MSYVVDFNHISTVGLESSPVAEALAGLRANEARYFMNKYKQQFTVTPAAESMEILAYVNRILKEERGIEIAAKPLETSYIEAENMKWAYVFYEDGLVVNVMYALDDPKKRAVGFKLSEGMEVPGNWKRRSLNLPDRNPNWRVRFAAHSLSSKGSMEASTANDDGRLISDN